MTLREWSALVSTVLVIVGCVWYAYQAIRRNTRPVFASWVVFSSVVVLSYLTYWTSPKPSFVSNASNAAKAIGGIIVVMAVAKIERRSSLRLTRFQKCCLLVTAAIGILWIILVWGLGLRGDLPFWMTQGVMLVGHSMTAVHLSRSKRNTEPFFTWWCLLIASAIAIYTAADMFALIYAVRATFSSSVIVWLMHRIRRKNGVTACPVLSH